MDPIRLKDSSGNPDCWQSPDGQHYVEIDEEGQTVNVETPLGSPFTAEPDFPFHQFRLGYGHDYIRSIFGDNVVQEIMEALPGVTGSRPVRSRGSMQSVKSPGRRRPMRKGFGTSR